MKMLLRFVFLYFGSIFFLCQVTTKSVKFKPHIYKGTSARENQFPWIAYLRIFSPIDDYSYTECGGTLIDNQHVLTAAHCLYREFNNTALTKDIYTILNITEKPWPMKNRYPTETYYIHPKFNISEDWIMGHDLAILKLASPVPIQPVCINVRGDFVDGQELITSGFGSIDAEGDVDNYNLNYVQVNYIPTDKCELTRLNFVEKQLASHKMSPNQVPVLTSTQLCAINQQTRGDTCAGDSGGPLLYTNGTKDFLVGTVTGSWTDCGSDEVPGIYTLVSEYLDWIESTGTKPCKSQ